MQNPYIGLKWFGIRSWDNDHLWEFKFPYILTIKFFFDFWLEVLCCLVMFESSFWPVMFDRCHQPFLDCIDIENWNLSLYKYRNRSNMELFKKHRLFAFATGAFCSKRRRRFWKLKSFRHSAVLTFVVNKVRLLLLALSLKMIESFIDSRVFPWSIPWCLIDIHSKLWCPGCV